MQTHATAMSVSEFLSSLATQERAQGLDTNAEVYEQRAIQAKELETEHATLLREYRGTAAELEDLRGRIKALAA